MEFLGKQQKTLDKANLGSRIWDTHLRSSTLIWNTLYLLKKTIQWFQMRILGVTLDHRKNAPWTFHCSTESGWIGDINKHNMTSSYHYISLGTPQLSGNFLLPRNASKMGTRLLDWPIGFNHSAPQTWQHVVISSSSVFISYIDQHLVMSTLAFPEMNPTHTSQPNPTLEWSECVKISQKRRNLDTKSSNKFVVSAVQPTSMFHLAPWTDPTKTKQNHVSQYFMLTSSP